MTHERSMGPGVFPGMEQAPPARRRGFKERDLAILLLALAAAASCWSTAATESLAIGFLAVALLAVRRRDRESRRLKTPPAGHAMTIVLSLWFSYMLGTVLSLFQSPSAAADPGYAGRFLHSALFPLVYAIGCSQDDIRRIGKLFIASASVASGIAIAGFLTSGHPRLESAFIGNTTFADLLTLAGILIIGFMVSGTTANSQPDARSWIRVKWPTLMLGLPILLAVFLSGQKAPILVLMAAGLLLAVVHMPRSVPLVATTLSALLLLAPRPFWLGLAWMAGGHPIDRYTIWDAGLKYAAEASPLGYGPDSFATLLPAAAHAAFVNRPPGSWHNDLLQTLIENGWITFIAYAGYIVTLMAVAFRAVRRMQPSPLRVASGHVVVLLAAMLVFSMVGSLVSTAILGIDFWILSGFVATLTVKGYTNG